MIAVNINLQLILDGAIRALEQQPNAVEYLAENLNPETARSLRDILNETFPKRS